MTARQVQLDCIEYNGYRYNYDNYNNFEIHGVVPYSETHEDRIMGVIGKSGTALSTAKKASNWLKGLIGGTEARWGPQFDKGHYIARAIGGGEQLNIFPQRRDLNRGRSAAGHLFREMEKYCVRNPGILCFHRPIYLDESAQPVALNFWAPD